MRMVPLKEVSSTVALPVLELRTRCQVGQEMLVEVGLVLLVELLLVVGAWAIGPGVPRTVVLPIPPAETVTNTEALGLVLYTHYVYFFQAAGLVLLVAMIGAIVLTLRHRPAVKRQNVSDQLARRKAAIIELHNVRPGQGI